MEPTPTDLAWAAGILEGEGSFRINARSRTNAGALMVEVTSIDRDMLEHLAELFGGTIHAKGPLPRRRQAYRWTVASRRAYDVLDVTRPYMRVARIITKVELALDYQAQKTRTRSLHTPEYLARQAEFYDRMKVLNVRGVPG